MAEAHFSPRPYAWWLARLPLIGTLALLAGALAPSGAAAHAITGFQWQPEKNQAVFRIAGDVEYHMFTLAHPARVVVDFPDTRPASGVHFSARPDSLIRDIRSAPRFSGKGERVVFDLSRTTKPHGFIRSNSAGKTLVIAFGPSKNAAKTAATATVSKKSAARNKARTTPAPDRPVITAANSRPPRLRDVVVVIDPGHGGHDSGAIGPDGLEEKTVTLAIGKDLYRDLSKIRGIKPVLTRNGDYFVTLGGRRKIAREAHADLFVAIHADSSPYHYPQGSTVYVLSQHGASSVAARILAQRENAVDEIGGVKLADEEPAVRSAIVKLAQRGSIAQGLNLAQGVMTKINDVVPLHGKRVERAPFAVLKSPDIPSILVETAFISNRHEEHQLASRNFREHIASAIAHGIKLYVQRFAPPGTLIAARRNAIYALQKG
ncbi:MAG: N-acetylmuramoyl-L-alanine amidase [Gammaproteobacteria bacterium]